MQALCPVKPENSKKSKPHTPSDEENAWSTAVMVATELVLHGPTSFKNKTKNVTEKTLFYVSYLRFEEKRATAFEVSPFIGGHKLSEKGCVKLYQDDSVKN